MSALVKRVLHGPSQRKLDVLNVEYNTQMQELKDLITSTGEGEVVYNNDIEGKCLLSNKDVAVQKVFMEKGEVFPEHAHPNCLEWIYILSGKLKYVKGNKEIIFNPGDWDIIGRSAEVHGSTAIEDTIVIATTIPKDRGYPTNG